MDLWLAASTVIPLELRESCARNMFEMSVLSKRYPSSKIMSMWLVVSSRGRLERRTSQMSGWVMSLGRSEMFSLMGLLRDVG